MQRLISDHDLFDDAILQGSNSADGWMSVVLTLIDVEVSLASLDLEISHILSCFDLVSPLFALLCVRRVELLLTNRSVDLFLCAFASPPSWWVFLWTKLFPIGLMGLGFFLGLWATTANNYNQNRSTLFFGLFDTDLYSDYNKYKYNNPQNSCVFLP